MYAVLVGLLIGCGGESSSLPAPDPVALPLPIAQDPEPPGGEDPRAPVPLCGNPTSQSITVHFGQDEAMLARLYTVSTYLPDAYTLPTRPNGAHFVPDTLKASIELYTRSSLVADQFQVGDVVADLAKGTVEITATGCNLSDYQTQLPAFLAAGVTGLKGWDTCRAAGGACDGLDQTHPCTSNPANTCIPWVFYLPLGQPLVNHWGVMLLDYPPADALCASDYQNNFTMHRWRQVLAWGGQPTIAWSGIVDVHPIAAYGADESDGIKKTSALFQGYVEQMLAVVTDPPNLKTRPTYGPGYTLPVMTAGSPSHDAWTAIVGSNVKTGNMGKTTKLVAGSSTAWVAMNHPDVTTYNCCKGDHSKSCCDGIYGKVRSPSPHAQDAAQCKPNPQGYAWSWSLAKDEVSDFSAACYFYEISARPSRPFDDFTVTCMNGEQWGDEALCVQARRDYQFGSEGHCNCQEAAELFCKANSQDVCPSTTALTSCAPFNAQAGCPDLPTSAYVQCAAE